jgi:hypothetical protein
MQRAFRLTRMIVTSTSVLLVACGEQAATPTAPTLGAASAAKAPPPPTPNVITTLYDADASGAPLLTRSDDFNGTTSATYTAINNITSEIDASGAWKLYLGRQTARTIRLTLASQGVPLPDDNYSSNVEVYSQCFDANSNQLSILTMTSGTALGNCSFGVDFSSGGTKYKFVMSPKFAGTGSAIVTCNAAAGAYCTSWTIVPNATVANAGVANLYTFSQSKGQAVLIYDGTYHNSYSVTAVQ